MSEAASTPQRWWPLPAFLLTTASLVALESVENPGLSLVELLIESIEPVLLAGAAVGVLYALVLLRSHHNDQVALLNDLEAARAEGARWRSEARELINGLGTAIDAQFELWDLTPAEREVASLLLKGLSHREIARVRSTSERTVRHQARAVYRKANLSGRAALSAFFLEDLLLPAEQREASG